MVCAREVRRLFCGLLSLLPLIRGQGIIFTEDRFSGTPMFPTEAAQAGDFVPSSVDGSDVLVLRGGFSKFNCRAPDGQLGVCGKFNTCPVLRKALTPFTSDKIRYLRRSICRFAGKLPIICCPSGAPQFVTTTSAPLVFVDAEEDRRPNLPPTKPTEKPQVTPTVSAVTETTVSESTALTPSSTAESVTASEQGSTGSSSPITVPSTSTAETETESPTETSPGTETTESSTDSMESSAETESREETTESTQITEGASTERVTEGATATTKPPEVTTEPAVTTPEDEERMKDERYSLPGLDECGHRNSSLVDRIIGGRESEPNAWPWLGAIGYELEKGKIEYLCGSALITERHVLTAAHCVRSEMRSVRFGDHDLFNDTEVDTVQEYDVELQLPHEQYNNRTFANDIAILRLSKPVQITDEVHTICVPTVSEMKQFSLEGKNPYIAGWGTTSFRGVASEVLKQTQVKVQRQSLCRSRYAVFRQKITERQLCAASRGQDACQGDSGGPMMHPGLSSDHWYVMGVVSFGFRCGEPRFPGVYTRVTAYLDWIADHLR